MKHSEIERFLIMNEKQVQKIDQNKKTKKHIRLKKQYHQKALIVIGILIVGIYAFGCFYYHDKFMAKASINGIDVSGLSSQKANDKVADVLVNQTLELTFIDQQKETLVQKDSGMTFNRDNDIEKSLKNQNIFLWFTHYFHQTQIELNNLLKINQDQLNQTISSLKHVDCKQEKPVDAKVEYKNHEFSIQKEVFGTKINQERLAQAVIDAFANQKKTLDVKKVKGYDEPKVTADDEKLKKLYEAAQKYCHASITYQTTKGDVVLDGNTLMTWLSIDESGNYYYNEDEFKKQATAFVKELASKINIISKAKTFKGANGTRTVSGGNYGYKLNQSKEVEGLLKDIQNQKNGKRTPVVTGVQQSYENGGIGHTFVEIDMTKQHMWYIRNGKVVLESDVITGVPTDPKKRTPGGTYYIYFMQRNRTLIGEMQPDGKPEYETPVAYWMAFNGGIGLHDATWQRKFGGNLYYTRGSHGCVNLPLGIAASLYDMVKVGTPVVCYY